MTRLIKNIATALLLIVIAVFVFQKLHVLPSWKNIFAPKAITVEETTMLVKQVKNIAQLMTVETYDEIVVDSTKTDKLNIAAQVLRNNPFAPIHLFDVPQIVLIMKGRVIAGIDMQKLKDSSIKVFKDSIAMQLPKAEVLDVITNPSDFETFSEKGTWTPEEIISVKQKGKAIILQHALQQNVLPKADLKAKTLIENIFKNAGYKKVSVTTI